MDKEQIMIDGVDVSECAYFDYENEGTRECDAYGNECEANNCYFKQFARKTQECDTLKSQLDFEVQQKECIEQECEKLKEECKALKSKIHDLRQLRELDREARVRFANQCSEYYKALKEIEEIVTKDYYEDNWAGITIKIDSIRNIIDKTKERK